MYDVVIVGSGPAGLSAAVYAQRASLSAVVIEKDYEGTGQIADSGRVDNYLGLPGISGYDLGETFRNHAVALGTEFLEQEVVAITRAEDGTFSIALGDGSSVSGRSVIYAAGAAPRQAGIPGEQEHLANGISYCAICDGSFYRGRTVAVLGGGDTALDDALYLSGLADKVYLVHRREQFRGAASTVERLREKDNVAFVLGSQPIAITGDDKVTGLDLASGQHLDVDGIFVAYGSVPRTEVLQGLVDLDPAGYVIAGEDGRTNVPHLYVAGDARTKRLRQVVTAVADGAAAATAVSDDLRR